MTPERYQACLGAYGADLTRWPEAERDAARGLAMKAAPSGDDLAAAGALDAWLATDEIAPPGDALLRLVLESAPPPPATEPARSPWWRARWRWTARIAGVGLAGCLSGVLAATLVLRIAPAPQALDPIDGGSAFSGAFADWSEE